MSARAVDQIIHHLRQAILRGVYPAGSRLPPERTLAENFKVNRLTLRAALAHLQAEGLLWARQGDGLHVLDWRETSGVDLIHHLADFGGIKILVSFLEMRRAMAAEAVALACQRASPPDLGRLRALAALQATETDLDRFIRRDLEFGRGVLRLADNLPMELLLNSVARLYLDHPEISAALLHDQTAIRASYLATIELIAHGDPELARTTVRQALEQIDQAALARLTPKT